MLKKKIKNTEFEYLQKFNSKAILILSKVRLFVLIKYSKIKNANIKIYFENSWNNKFSNVNRIFSVEFTNLFKKKL